MQKIVGYFHVALKGNHQSLYIFSELLGRVLESGLYSRSEAIYVSILGDKTQTKLVTDVILKSYPKFIVRMTSEDFNLYEFATLDLMKKDALECEEERYVWYIHTKGVFHVEIDKRPIIMKNIVKWRNAMSTVVLTRFQECIDKLNANFDAVGGFYAENSEMQTDPKFIRHFSGNFWWSKYSYVKSLKDIDHTDRHNAERLLGTGNGKFYSMTDPKALEDLDMTGYWEGTIGSKSGPGKGRDKSIYNEIMYKKAVKKEGPKATGYFHVALMCEQFSTYVLSEMIGRMLESGVYDRTDRIYVSLLGERKQSLKVKRFILDNYDKFFVINYEEGFDAYEWATLDIIKDDSERMNGLVWYAHLKGVSNTIKSSLTVQKSLQHWRNLMCRAIFTQYDRCISLLEENPLVSAVGTLLYEGPERPHLAGNFWWSSYEFIKNKVKVKDCSKTRQEAEFWISSPNEKIVSLDEDRCPVDPYSFSNAPEGESIFKEDSWAN